MKALIASNNKNKLAELTAILGDMFEFVTPAQLGIVSDPEENGETFRENARIKAVSGMEASGLACVADDSGLCVDCLGGAPGINSARYAGEHGDDNKNIDLLLENIKQKPAAAQFVCHIYMVFPDGTELDAEGICKGEIIGERRGEGGFGYDPVFYLPEYGKTYAELPTDVKNKISHRARAVEELRKKVGKINDK